MKGESVISCPKCLRQYRADGPMNGKLGRCDGCNAFFTICVPYLTEGEHEAITFGTALEIRYHFFGSACCELSQNLVQLFELARQPLTIDAIVLMLRWMPRDVGDVDTRWWRNGYFNEVVKLAAGQCNSPEEKDRFVALRRYFLEYLPRRSFESLGHARIRLHGSAGWIKVKEN